MNSPCPPDRVLTYLRAYRSNEVTHGPSGSWGTCSVRVVAKALKVRATDPQLTASLQRLHALGLVSKLQDGDVCFKVI